MQAKQIKLHNRRVRLYPVEDDYDHQTYMIEFQHYEKGCREGDYNAMLGGVHTYTERDSRTIRVKLSWEALEALKHLISEEESL